MLVRYVYGAGIDQPLTMERNGNRYYYHPDPQGSIAAHSVTATALSYRDTPTARAECVA